MKDELEPTLRGTVEQGSRLPLLLSVTIRQEGDQDVGIDEDSLHWPFRPRSLLASRTSSTTEPGPTLTLPMRSRNPR